MFIEYLSQEAFNGSSSLLLISLNTSLCHTSLLKFFLWLSIALEIKSNSLTCLTRSFMASGFCLFFQTLSVTPIKNCKCFSHPCESEVLSFLSKPLFALISLAYNTNPLIWSFSILLVSASFLLESFRQPLCWVHNFRAPAGHCVFSLSFLTSFYYNSLFCYFSRPLAYSPLPLTTEDSTGHILGDQPFFARAATSETYITANPFCFLFSKILLFPLDTTHRCMGWLTRRKNTCISTRSI